MRFQTPLVFIANRCWAIELQTCFFDSHEAFVVQSDPSHRVIVQFSSISAWQSGSSRGPVVAYLCDRALSHNSVVKLSSESVKPVLPYDLCNLCQHMLTCTC